MTRQACDACHKRKISCDYSPTATGQQCNWCSHHHLTCTFNRVRGRRRKRAVQTESRPASGTPPSAAERTDPGGGSRTTYSCLTPGPSAIDHPFGERHQSSLHLDQSSAYKSSPPIKLLPPGRNTVAGFSFGQIYFAGRHLGQISSLSGIPAFSTEGRKLILSLTGAEPCLPVPAETGGGIYLHPYTPHAPGSTSSTTTAHPSEGLPPRETTEALFVAYLTSHVRLVFPVIDRVLFAETIRIAYEPWTGPPSPQPLMAKACVLAFLAILYTFQLDASPELEDNDIYASRAQHLLSDVLEDASIVAIQTTFMLLMNHMFSGRLHSTSLLHAMACRSVFMLGGHLAVPSRPIGPESSREERERSNLRMLFWLCYVFDKDLVLRNGQPPTIVDQFCDMTLPHGYPDYSALSGFIEHSTSQTNDALVPSFPGDLRLSILKAKAFRLLYSADASTKSDADLLRDVRMLDEELESWRMSVPPEFRPALSVSIHTRVHPHIKPQNSMQQITLHLEYHYLMTTIHRVNARFPYWPSDMGSGDIDRRAGIMSSMALSVEASRSTLIYLKAAVHGLSSDAFWAVIFYPTAALLGLFFNILMDPLGPQVDLDLEYLTSATDLIQSMPTRKLTQHEVASLETLDAFVADLIRLAHSAIRKSKKEKRLEVS